MAIIDKIFKQEKTGMAWGRFKAIVSSASSYASWVSLAMQSVVLYTVATPIMNAKNIEIPFWTFCLLIGIFVISILLFEWKVTIPSAVKFTNEQAYKHNNPMRTDLEEIKADNQLLKKQNKKIMEKLGIK